MDEPVTDTDSVLPAPVTAPIRVRSGRPRSERTEALILKATTEFLTQNHLRAITVDAIATRAGVSKATVYKWWPNKYFLALNAFMALVSRDIPVVDTGSAISDFILQLKITRDFYNSPVGNTFKEMMTEGHTDKAFSKVFLEQFLLKRREKLRIIWQRGIERGEINPVLDVDMVHDMLYGPLLYRALTGHASLSDDELDRLVRAVFTGIGRA